MADEPSVEQLQECIRSNPSDAVAYSDLGNALMKRGQWGEAVTAWREALRLNPEDSHAELAITLTITGDEPIVKPSAELIQFLMENGSGYFFLPAFKAGKILPQPPQ